MHFDVDAYLGAVTRSVAAMDYDGKPARAVTLSRTYDTPVDDLWDAVTNAERLPRWFLPVSGDLVLGGRYQLQGNAGGTIKECEPPHRLFVTWEFGGGMSWVEVRLAAEGGQRSRLTLTHIAPVDEHWEKFGPGAVGVGWDLGLVGLALHTAGGKAEDVRERFDEETFAASAQGKTFITGSSEDWGRASIAAGTEAEAARSAAKRTTAFYTGEASGEEA